MNLEPPSDRVILRPHDPEVETAFGLALPEIVQGKSQYATVLAVGKGKPYPDAYPYAPGLREPTPPVRDPVFHLPLGQFIQSREAWEKTRPHSERGLIGPGALIPLEPGDVVLMPRFNGTEIDWPGEGTVISILASELLAVVA